MHMYLNLKKACRGEASQKYQALKTTFLLRMNCALPLPEVVVGSQIHGKESENSIGFDIQLKYLLYCIVFIFTHSTLGSVLVE